jgi:hypothetical protein
VNPLKIICLKKSLSSRLFRYQLIEGFNNNSLPRDKLNRELVIINSSSQYNNQISAVISHRIELTIIGGLVRIIKLMMSSKVGL